MDKKEFVQAVRDAEAKIEGLVFEYNQLLFSHDQELHDLASDQADYDLAISQRLRAERAVVRKVGHLPRNLHALVLRQVSELLAHKAMAFEEMDKKG